MPEISVDYAFIRQDDEKATILVAKGREVKVIQAAALRMKGTCVEEAGDKAVQLLISFGHKGKILIKTDNELALHTLRDETIRRLPQGETPIEPRDGESQSNGVVDSGERIFKGVPRVHLLALERNIGEGKIPSTHPIIAWLVEYVADVVSKYLSGADDKSAYQLLYGISSSSSP